MTISELATFVTRMAGVVGGKVVSKRSNRVFVDDGDEHKIAEARAKRASKGEDALEAAAEAMERRASTSSHSVAGSEASSSRFHSDRSESDRWADPTEPLSWDDGKLLLEDFLPQPDAPHLAEAAEAGLLFRSVLPLTGRPTNFGIVVQDVYRCGYPQAEDYPFIKGLKLKTVVTLVQKDLPEGYKPFLDELGIRHVVFDMQGTKKQDIPIKTMKAILSLILDRQNHPVLIHCNHGKHRTGCVVGVIRKITGWDLGAILDEYKSFANPKERECDIRYITAFDLAGISSLFARKPRRELPAKTYFMQFAAFTAVVLLIWIASSYSSRSWAGSVEGTRRRISSLI